MSNDQRPTPRTDAARLDKHDPYEAVAAECSKLERELAAANERLRRLEHLSQKNPHCALGHALEHVVPS